MAARRVLMRFVTPTHTFFPRDLTSFVLPIFPLTGVFTKIRLILMNFTKELFSKNFFEIDFSPTKI